MMNNLYKKYLIVFFVFSFFTVIKANASTLISELSSADQATYFQTRRLAYCHTSELTSPVFEITRASSAQQSCLDKLREIVESREPWSVEFIKGLIPHASDCNLRIMQKEVKEVVDSAYAGNCDDECFLADLCYSYLRPNHKEGEKYSSSTGQSNERGAKEAWLQATILHWRSASKGHPYGLFRLAQLLERNEITGLESIKSATRISIAKKLIKKAATVGLKEAIEVLK